MEEDKKPCDDIFEGLAELLIKNGQIIHNVYTVYTRSRACDDCVLKLHSRETWGVSYGGYTYLLTAHDGEFDSIERIR